MSTLKLKGSSSGEVGVTVPATVANQTITLPAAAPSAGQFLKATDTSGTTTWDTPGGTTINNNADNRVITGSGSADTLEGESNLTFDGSNLTCNSTVTTKTLNLDGTVESSASAGDIWYNDGTFYFGSNIASAWSSGGSLNLGRYVHGVTGIQTAGLMSGGWWGGATPSGGKALQTEEYNGSAWSVVNQLNTYCTTSDNMCGTQTAALYSTQNTNSAVNNSEYDGTTWTVGTDSATSHFYGSCFGLQNAAVLCGGSPGGTKTNATEEWNGSAWSSGGNMNNSKQQHGTCGTITVGLTAGGNDGAAEDDTEEYDGTSWSTGNDMNQTYQTHGMSGTQSDAFAVGGTVDQDGTSLYDGTTWTAAANTSGTHPNTAAGGVTSAGYVVGGSGTQTQVEEYNYSTTVNTSGVGGLS